MSINAIRSLKRKNAKQSLKSGIFIQKLELLAFTLLENESLRSNNTNIFEANEILKNKVEFQSSSQEALVANKLQLEDELSNTKHELTSLRTLYANELELKDHTLQKLKDENKLLVNKIEKLGSLQASQNDLKNERFDEVNAMKKIISDLQRELEVSKQAQLSKEGKIDSQGKQIKSLSSLSEKQCLEINNGSIKIKQLHLDTALLENNLQKCSSLLKEKSERIDLLEKQILNQKPKEKSNRFSDFVRIKRENEILRNQIQSLVSERKKYISRPKNLRL
eukprot:TRINITY_DN6283_c0_g1_i3.p1 TRINITY_DN6283_c0_g1~~TRINITY_DN6283_c0_g1_i3.p1  ORF type:complete len:279 (-),score=43.68 TRINITY_DN6283_c0_g1_i3:468-1304(-)